MEQIFQRVSNTLMFLSQMTFQASSSVMLLFDFWDVHTPAGKQHAVQMVGHSGG